MLEILVTNRAKPSEIMGAIQGNTYGLYAIMLKKPEALAQADQEIYDDFCARALPHNVIYIGKGDNLKKRLRNELGISSGPATFIRSIGPVLGFRPSFGQLVNRANQNNYRFGANRLRIRDFIEENCLASYLETPNYIELEHHLISVLQPLFNIQYNPNPNGRIIELRKLCRCIARGEIQE